MVHSHGVHLFKHISANTSCVLMSISTKPLFFWQSGSNAAQALCVGVANLKGRHSMSEDSTYAGMAALSICESLLLALNDAQLLPERHIIGILEDAVTAHENVDESDSDIDTHKKVAEMINGIITGGNSVRRG